MLTAIIFFTALSSIYLVRRTYRRYTSKIIPRKVENYVDHVMADVDHVDFSDDEEGGGLFYPGLKGASRFQAKMVRIAKGEFGLLERSEANRLMVRKFVRDYMREHGVRPTHIGMHVDLVVAMFFIPSHIDILSSQMQFTNTAKERDDLRMTVWTNFCDYWLFLPLQPLFWCFGAVKKFVVGDGE